MERILGVLPEFVGIRIDPAVLSSWKKIEEFWQGTEIQIIYNNKSWKCTGLISVYLDGTEISLKDESAFIEEGIIKKQNKPELIVTTE